MTTLTTRPDPSYITFANVDRVCQYIPVTSTLLNLDVLFEKYVHRNECIIDNLGDRKISYIQTKNMTRTLIGLIPILGNVILLLDLLRAKIFGVQKTQNLNADIFEDYCLKAGTKQRKGINPARELSLEEVEIVKKSLKDNEYAFCRAMIKESDGPGYFEIPHLFITSQTALRIDPDTRTVIELKNLSVGSFHSRYNSFESLLVKNFPQLSLTEIKRKNGRDFL